MAFQRPFASACLCVVLVSLLGESLSAQQPIPATPPPLPARFRVLQSQYYVITTDLPPAEAQEATLRLTRMAEEYAERTKGFAGRVNKRYPIYLFQQRVDYNNAGGPQGSAGMFVFGGNNSRLLVWAGESGDPRRWVTMQHEGFHQFADAAIGELPTWIDEGLAEYFGESIWTGDSFVTGVIPPERLKRLRDLIAEKRLLTVRDVMQLKLEQWNLMTSPGNYHQAWSMTQFLAHGENGRYQNALSNALRAFNRKVPWEKAWLDAFGPADGFEAKWTTWCTDLPEDPTAALYTRATLSTFASFIARAHSQQKSYRTIDDLASALNVGELKLTGENWLPPTLLAEAIARSKRDATTFTIEPGKARGGPPTVVANRPDGMRMVASFPPRLVVPVKVTIDVTQGIAANKPQPGLPGLPGPFAPKPPPPNPVIAPPVTPPPQPPTAGITPPNRPADPPVLVRPPGPGQEPPKPPVPGAPGTAGVAVAGLTPAREKAIEFVANNNSFGKDHQIVADVTDNIDRCIKEGSDLRFTFGGNLLKSGRTTMVFVQAGRCYIIEFTGEQSRRLGLGPDTMKAVVVRPEVEERGAPKVEIDPPMLMSASPISSDEKTTWSTRFRRVDQPSDRLYSVRMRYLLNDVRAEGSWTFRQVPKVTELPFNFSLPGPGGIARPTPIVLFLDVCHLPDDGKAEKTIVLSETFALVVDVQPKQ